MATLSDYNGQDSFTIGGNSFINRASSGTPIYERTGGGDGGSGGGDGWLDNAYWTRGVKVSNIRGGTGYQWIYNNVSSPVGTAKPMTDHDWYDNKGKLVDNFSVPSSYYLRFEGDSLWDYDGNSNPSLAVLIADGREGLDSLVQTEDRWWANGMWTVKNSYEKQRLASEVLGSEYSPGVGSVRGPGYNGGAGTTLSFIIDFSTNSIRGHYNHIMYLIPA